MRKTFTTLLLAGFAFTASAQYQIQNGNFEEWENVGSATEEPAHWNSFKTASGSLTSFGKKQVEKLSENAPGSNPIMLPSDINKNSANIKGKTFVARSGICCVTTSVIKK